MGVPRIMITITIIILTIIVIITLITAITMTISLLKNCIFKRDRSRCYAMPNFNSIPRPVPLVKNSNGVTGYRKLVQIGVTLTWSVTTFKSHRPPKTASLSEAELPDLPFLDSGGSEIKTACSDNPQTP